MKDSPRPLTPVSTNPTAADSTSPTAASSAAASPTSSPRTAPSPAAAPSTLDGTPAATPVPGTFGGFDIEEKRLAHLTGGPAALVLLLDLAALIGAVVLYALVDHSDDPAALAISATVLMIVSVLVMTGFSVIQPGHTLVGQFFGKYIGTIRTDGFTFTYPLTSRKKLSVRVRNFETNELKINDEDGNPVTTAAIVVWTVGDTARASFAVKDYEAFIETQAEAALRHVISTHPYDEGNRTNVVSLRGSTDDVSQELADEVAARVSSAGLTIIEARISSLAYAPEIAQAMLQRQQAAAVVAARERIVEGAVSMVQDALRQLEDHDIVELDDERRAAMVSNLLVVLCSDNHVSPVVNTGTLYN